MDRWAIFAFALLALLNAATISAAFYDKIQARGGGRRVRERSLLLMALVGGSPGLLVAMALARHKVRKASFLVAVLFIVLLQAAAVLALTRL